jgi:peptidoglycan hydrolase-like protein with peptidoglycan-binding domain
MDMKKRYLILLAAFLLLPNFASAELSARTLKYGDISPNVRELQIALNSIGKNITNRGEETTRFGERTLSAIKSLQCERSIACAGDPSHGIFGPRTRALLISLLQKNQPRVLGATTDGLIAHYAFDGNANDSAGSNHGTASGGPTYAAGKVGQGITLEGTDDYIDIPDTIEGLSTMTVAAWVKPSDLSGATRIIINQSGAGSDPIILDYARGTGTNDFKYRCILDNGTITAAAQSPVFNDSNWHHIACVYNGSDVKLYIDSGSPSVSAGVFNGSLAASANNLTIGIPNTTTWAGALDDIRIYSTALSAVQISEIFALGGGGDIPPGDPSDTTFPTISLTAPLNNTTVSSVISLTATANDNIGVASVQFKLDGTNLGSADTSSPYSLSWNTTTVTNGIHTLTATARDAAGNTTTSSVVAVTVSNGVSTSGVYYVDQDHPSANDGNPGTEALPFKTIQKAVSVVRAGETVLIKAGIYEHRIGDCPTSQCPFVTVSNSGTPSNPIIIKAYGDGPVILSGLGFKDYDSNSDGLADGPNYSAKREKLMNILGNYIHVSDLEFTNSQQSGLEINGSFNKIENIKSHDNWASNISIGGSVPGLVQGNVIRYAEAYRSRTSSGIGLGRDDPMTDVLTKNIIEYSLAYDNGRKLDGTRMMPSLGDSAGGGNSDGMGSTKACADYPIFTPSFGAIHPNACPQNTFRYNFMFRNTDDGVDMSHADSLMERNISFGNGGAAGGGKGYKVLRQILNDVFINNIAYANRGIGFDLRISNIGFHNNIAVSNGAQGISGAGSVTIMRNNIAHDNTFSDFPVSTTCVNCSHNWIEDRTGSSLSGDPKFVNPTLFKTAEGEIVVSLPNLPTVAEKWLWLDNQFKTAFALKADSGAINTGTSISFVDPVTNTTRVLSYVGSAPDLGVFESGSTGDISTDTTPPTISITSPSGSISGIVSISATATDNIGVVGVQFKLNGIDMGAEDTTAPYIGEWNTAAIPNGTYVLTAAARDAANNMTTSAPVTVIISNALNRAPIANAGANQTVSLPANVTLSGSASSDPDLDSLTYGWSKISGPNSFTMTNPLTATPGVSFTARGTYTFRLTVSDGSLTSSDTVDIIVEDAPSDIGDTDGDGVYNDSDRCPNTPPLLRDRVNRYGCVRPRIAGFDIRPDLDQDISALDNLELGRSGLGKILFKERVSLSREAEELNIEDNLKIEKNKIILNAANLPELNKRAEISLETDFKNPQIRKDGAACSDCVKKLFANNVFVFEVNGFSTYEIVEGEVSGGGGTGGGGGGWTGGSGGVTIHGNASVTPVLCTPGQTFNTTTGQRCTTTSGSPSVVYTFTRNLTIGAKGEDVKQLQIFLNANGFTIAATGAGSRGNETTTFGPATRAALARYQASKGITPAVGYFGPTTRARVNGGEPNIYLPPPTASASSGTSLKLGAFGPAVKTLRTKLRNLGYFAAYGSSPDVPASAATETSTFGATTESAVKKYQCDKSIVCTGSPSTTGWGVAGARTRGSLGM